MSTKHRLARWPVCALTGILSLMISASAVGIPGEKESELEKRYGKPVKVEEMSYWEDAKNLVYRWNGYEIAVFLCKGKRDWWKGSSQREIVTKPKGDPFSADEINKWLEWSGAGQKWIENFEHLNANQDPAPTAKTDHAWRRADNKVWARSGISTEDDKTPTVEFGSQEMNEL
jgi:hypothetical protein